VLCTGALADKQQDRLQLSKSLDAITIDDSQGDPVEQILEATNGVGTDRGVEAVGYQAHDHSGDEHPELVLDNLVKTARTTGGIGVRDLIIAGRAKPGWIVSHELGLDQAVDAYEKFDQRLDGWTKVLLHP
jgi:glutathione-independent formaldehyde dehydrogenase